MSSAGNAETAATFFTVQIGKKEEGEHPVSKKPKKTKEEIEEAKLLKIKKKEEEEQNRWRWFGEIQHFLSHISLTHGAKCGAALFTSQHVFFIFPPHSLASCQVGGREIRRRSEVEVPRTQRALLPSGVPTFAQRCQLLLQRSVKHRN